MRTQLQSSYEIFNHIAIQMKNSDNVTPIIISPCLASLGSSPMISIIAKPKILNINVLGGGCPSKWCWSTSKVVILLFMLIATILHILILLQHFPLDWTTLYQKDKMYYYDTQFNIIMMNSKTPKFLQQNIHMVLDDHQGFDPNNNFLPANPSSMGF